MEHEHGIMSLPGDEGPVPTDRGEQVPGQLPSTVSSLVPSQVPPLIVPPLVPQPILPPIQQPMSPPNPPPIQQPVARVVPLAVQPISAQPLQVLSYATPEEPSNVKLILIRVGAGLLVVAGVILVGGSLFAAIFWFPTSSRVSVLEFFIELIKPILLGVLFLIGGVPRLRKPPPFGDDGQTKQPREEQQQLPR